MQGRTGSFHLKQLIQESVVGATTSRLATNEIAVDKRNSAENSYSSQESEMPQLGELMGKFLADGKIDSREVETLGALLYTDRKIDRTEAEFLIEVHRRVERVSPGFEKFFYKAIKQHVLTDGMIDPEKAEWLRELILVDGKVDEREKKLIRELRGEASYACPEFEAVYEETLL